MSSRRLVTLFALGVAALAAAVLITGTRSAVRRAAPPLPRQVLTPPAVTLASLRGKPALINFWASWCHPCQEEAPRLQRFAASLGGRGRLVGIDYGDNVGDARAFIRRYKWTFPVLRDGNDTTGAAYNIPGLPTTAVLDAQGRIVKTLIGPQTQRTLEAALKAAQ